MYILTMRWTVMIAVFIFAVAGAGYAQRSWEAIPNYEGLRQENGMLIFSSKSVFDLVYQDLEQRIRDWYSSPEARAPAETPGQPCPDDNVVLELFEQTYRFSSVRKAFLQRECEWLASGGDPLAFEGQHLEDEILGALFNGQYQAQVGSDIYYIPRRGLTYIIANRDLEALRALERGANPFDLENVMVYGPESECSADFSVNTNSSTTSVGFAHTGEPKTGNILYFWEFGDGTTSMEKTPVHNFSQAGEYTVCLTIEAISVPCTDKVCKTIQVGSGGCLPFFVYSETGQPGGICFLDNTQYLENVVKWTWSFGDGSEGDDVPNPCHIFPCDKTFFVTLSIETSSGCSGVFGLPVEVDSYDCCSRKASLKDDYYYSNNLKKIKYHQHQIQIPLLYYRVVATVTNYALNANGKWRKEEASLKIDLFGNVYLPSEAGCECDMPFDISKTEMAFNKKQMTITKAIGKFFKAKKNFEWGARYFVNNMLLSQQTTPVTCD